MVTNGIMFLLTDRIKLTEDDFDYCTHGLLVMTNCKDGKDLELTKQILDDHEKINLLTASELRDSPLLKVAGEQELEIRQLKEDRERAITLAERGCHIAEVQEQKLEKIKGLVDNCIYHMIELNPKQVKKILQGTPPKLVTYEVTCTKCDLEVKYEGKSLEYIKEHFESYVENNKAVLKCLHEYSYKLVSQK